MVIRWKDGGFDVETFGFSSWSIGFPSAYCQKNSIVVFRFDYLLFRLYFALGIPGLEDRYSSRLGRLRIGP